MAAPLVSDELWALVEALLPPLPPKDPLHPGRPRVPDRAAFTGIVFVLKTGIPWEMLPREMGCGSGMTCWRRLRAWQEAGVFDMLHRLMLEHLQWAGAIDWSRVCLDSSTVRARGGGEKDGTESGGPGPSGGEAPPGGRRRRHPPGVRRDGRQRVRRDHAGDHGGGHPGALRRP